MESNMDLDLFEKLSKYKEELIEQGGEWYPDDIDTVKVVDELNVAGTKGYKESSKRIFKEDISEENSKEIMVAVLDVDTYSKDEINSYKKNLSRICINKCLPINENPVEILLFATQGLYGRQEYKNAIPAVIRDIYEENEDTVKVAFNNILKSWSFEEPIRIVLKSIRANKIVGLEDGIYNILEKNIRLRDDAAMALVAVNATDKYRNVINLIASQRNISSEEAEIYKGMLRGIATSSEESAFILYKFFIGHEATMDNIIRNSMMLNIYKNYNEMIFADMGKKIHNRQIEWGVQKRIAQLLEKSQNNIRCVELLREAKGVGIGNNGTVILGGSKEELLDRLKSDFTSKVEKAELVIRLTKDGINSDLAKVLNEEAEKSELVRVAVCSAKAQDSSDVDIVELFKILVQKDKEDANQELVRYATNQIRRLISLRKPRINKTLNDVAKNLLANEEEKHINKSLEIIKLFTNNATSNEIGRIFLDKLVQTEHSVVKDKLIEYFKREYSKFDDSLEKEIRDSIVKATKNETDKNIQEKAIECLKVMSKLKESLPTLN